MQFNDVVTDTAQFREVMGEPPPACVAKTTQSGPALPRLYREVAFRSDCVGERAGTDGYFPEGRCSGFRSSAG